VNCSNQKEIKASYLLIKVGFLFLFSLKKKTKLNDRRKTAHSHMMAMLFTDEVYLKNFDKLKSQQSVSKDASRKASIDEHISDLVDLINNSENYFTTSSCSGRFLAFAQVRPIV
jgi:plasmid rolling circle replication initiator protein Rep